MINEISIISNQPDTLYKDANNLILAPHKLLRPYIANYTFTNPRTMSDQQTILPTASNTLVYSLNSTSITNGLRGVNTKPTTIGTFARQFDFMFLIEFHPGGLYPFIKIDQTILLDHSFSFEDLSKNLNKQILEAYDLSDNIADLKHRLDTILLSCLDETVINPALTYSIKFIRERKGIIRSKDLSEEVYYSKKQLNRLFQKNIGTTIKTFSRIVRLKYAVDLLNSPLTLSQLPEITGYYDLSHFIHDFQNTFGFTPTQFRNNMSLFYNDPFK